LKCLLTPLKHNLPLLSACLSTTLLTLTYIHIIIRKTANRRWPLIKLPQTTLSTTMDQPLSLISLLVHTSYDNPTDTSSFYCSTMKQSILPNTSHFQILCTLSIVVQITSSPLNYWRGTQMQERFISRSANLGRIPNSIYQHTFPFLSCH
jgi:hypothetical protein